MGFREDIFTLVKSHDWEACHKRIDEEEPGLSREQRASIAHWRSAVLVWQGRYEDALRIIDASKADAFTECGRLWDRAQILCRMGKFAEAIETLRGAPFGSEIDAFPGMTYEAIFLYCRLLIRCGREPPPNLLAALPDDFDTFTYDRRFMSKADLLSSTGRSSTSS
ncbi:hypothetical protein DFR50_13464 [Roseiarcus fermentans]|uniref:Tetratricopeptide repeat protein n=1 Tax=Roseiarcus fermentans TaxID=1473586 RepID=A0A366ETI7_9HYPH|nr:hypothetical protein [Roseiarcus fermentans]RBP05701.1 hypothetical protein DFR50_13464 [Roseiarcus fermentans]